MKTSVMVEMNYYGETLYANIQVGKRKHRVIITNKDGVKLADFKENYNSYMDKFLGCVSYHESPHCEIKQDGDLWSIILDNYLTEIPFHLTFCDPLELRKKDKEINRIYQTNK